MASGVAVEPDCVTEFNQMKIRNAHSFIVYKIDNGSIKIEKKGSPTAPYTEFLACLPKQDCRYAAVDVEVAKGKRKIAFFMWAPEVANVKSKMVYAASKDALRKKLDGISKEIQANDAVDLAYADIKTALLNTA